MTSSLSTSDLQKRIVALEAEVKEMHERLEPLERGAIKIDPAERALVDRQHEVCTKAWKQRKKMVQTRRMLVL